MNTAELKTFALMVGAICGWEVVKWLERIAKASQPTDKRCNECGAVLGMKHMPGCLEDELFAARRAAFSEALRVEGLRSPSASPSVEAESPAGGRKIDDHLWQFDCGCIEGVRPYHWYPCLEHRRRRAAWAWWRRSEMPEQ